MRGLRGLRALEPRVVPATSPSAERADAVRFRDAVLVVVGYVAVTALQVWWAEGWDDRGTADAAVVLGAAQYNGRPSPVFAARLDHAYELYAAKRVPKVVVTGGSKAGDRFTEAYSGLKYLQGKGVPGDDVIGYIQAFEAAR